MGVPFDASMKALAALVCAGFATVLLSARPRSARIGLLSVFLFLIAGNQACETLRALVEDDAAKFFWFRIATVLSALDPFVLAWFVSHLELGERLRRGPLLPLILAGAGTLALYAGYGLDSWPLGISTFSLLLNGYTVAVYAGLALMVVPAALRDHTHRERYLLAALLLVALPATPNLGEPIVVALGGFDTGPAFWRAGLAVEALLTAAIAIAVLVVARRLGPMAPSAQRWLYGSIAAPLALWVFLDAFHIGRVLVQDHATIDWLITTGRSGAPLRWLLFCGAVSIALLGAPESGFTLGVRRRAARLLIGMGILGSSAVALAVADVTLPPFQAVLLVVLALLSQGFRGLVDQVAARVYGVPLPSDVSGRHASYRLAAARVIAEGRVPSRDAELQQLRADLALDEDTARAIEQVADDAGAEPLTAGRLVRGRYRVRRLVGRGGAGRAFLADDLLLEREVAIKEVFHDDDDPPLLKEARMAGAVSHPNVVRVLDVVERPGATLLVTEFVRGGALNDRVATRGRLPLEAGIRLVQGVLAGLAAVHREGVVHRDLKPANILLDADGAPKIGDFGIAARRTPETIHPGLVSRPLIGPGTPGFMAPEQERGEPPTPAADVFAVGRIVRETIVHPLPPSLEEVVARALAADPRARWQDAAQMAEAWAVAARREAAQ